MKNKKKSAQNCYRFMGSNSNFYKSLKAFGNLGVVDKKNPNVVVVMTWVCSIPHRNVSKWVEKMEFKTNEIKRVVRETLHVNAPVVWIENNIVDYELENSIDGEQSLLPGINFKKEFCPSDFLWKVKES